MTAVIIRRSGGAHILSIPKAIIKIQGLKVGSKLDLTIENNQMVLTPIKPVLSLEDLLSGSPKECFELTEEDNEWLDDKSVGKEL